MEMRKGADLNTTFGEVKAHEILSDGGEMGNLIRSKDWSKTPLGPIESWPQSLLTTVSLCLASNFPICIIWGPENIQIYNDGYIANCGDRHPEALGEDFTKVWAEAMPVVGEAFYAAKEGKASYVQNQRMFINRYGFVEEIFVTFSFSPIRDESGGVGGVFHPLTEQTAKMLSERRTHAIRDLTGRISKEKSVESVFKSASEALSDYELDLPFTLFYILDKDVKTTHLVASTGIGNQISGLEHIELNVTRWPFNEVINTNSIVEVNNIQELLGISAYGPYPEVPYQALVLPISLPGADHPLGMVVAGVSPRLILNDVYQGFYDFVVSSINTGVANAEAYEQERKRAEALAEIDSAKTAFFSNVSHEFRTPLTLMLGPLEDVLAEEANHLTPESKEMLLAAHRNALRLQKLVNTLLDFSRIEAGRIQASYRPTDISGLTAELASNFRSAIEKAGLRLIVECPPLQEPIYVDQDMWEKIVLNLLSNAFKHTFEGEIRVKISSEKGKAKLTVSDTGVGIPAHELPQLLERFHRVPNTRSRTHEGSGIGLALVNELVKLHGGTISAESQVDKGTTLTVLIPTGKEHLPADRIEAATTLSSTALGANSFVQEMMGWLPQENEQLNIDLGSSAKTSLELFTKQSLSGENQKPRILIAEDNRDMLEYIHRLLAPYCEVETVSNGKAALTSAAANTPDLIFS